MCTPGANLQLCSLLDPGLGLLLLLLELGGCGAGLGVVAGVHAA